MILNPLFLFHFALLFRNLFSLTDEQHFNTMFASDIVITRAVVTIGNPYISIMSNGFFLAVWSLNSKSKSQSGIKGQMFNNFEKLFLNEINTPYVVCITFKSINRFSF